MLKAEHITKQYQIPGGGHTVFDAVSDVSIELGNGGVTAIVGESGSGKSTLARVLSYVERPDGGRVFLDGLEVSACGRKELRAVRGKVQLVMQNALGSLDPHQSVVSILEEPLRLLFKDEVRQLGRELGLPEYLVSRQPFPGPGLAIRIIGDITKEKADILRQADFIFRDEIAKAGEDKNLNQYFAVLTNTRSVGVMGDGRTYDYTLALRAVTTSDFMTADWARIPYEVLDKISVRIVNEVQGINRICYDITSKPPATIEWE